MTACGPHGAGSTGCPAARAAITARGDAGLVLALVGEQRVAVDVAQGVQPAAGQGADHAGVVDLQPGPGDQAHGVQADVVGERGPAGGEQRLVGLHLAAVFQGQGDRPGAARAAHPGDGDADPHIHPGLG